MIGVFERGRPHLLFLGNGLCRRRKVLKPQETAQTIELTVFFSCRPPLTPRPSKKGHRRACPRCPRERSGDDRHPPATKKGGSDQPGPRGWSRGLLDTNPACPDFPDACEEGRARRHPSRDRRGPGRVQEPGYPDQAAARGWPGRDPSATRTASQLTDVFPLLENFNKAETRAKRAVTMSVPMAFVTDHGVPKHENRVIFSYVAVLSLGKRPATAEKVTL